MTKGDSSINFPAGRIINHRKHPNSCYRDENKHSVTSYGMIYKAMSYVTLLCMCKLSSTSYISYLTQTEDIFQTALVLFLVQFSLSVSSSIFWDMMLCSPLTTFALLATCFMLFLAWLILWSWRWRWHVPPKFQLTSR
jgi:hypothetical protein